MFKNWITCQAFVAVNNRGKTKPCNHRFPPKLQLYPWIFCGGDICLRSPDRLKKKLERVEDE